MRLDGFCFIADSVHSLDDFRRAISRVLHNLELQDAVPLARLKEVAVILEEVAYEGMHPALVAVAEYYDVWQEYEEKGENEPLSECGRLHDLYLDLLCECGASEVQATQLVEDCINRTHEILSNRR